MDIWNRQNVFITMMLTFLLILVKLDAIEISGKWNKNIINGVGISMISRVLCGLCTSQNDTECLKKTCLYTGRGARVLKAT
ncbi:hypothetical protein DPMN_140718 [Dreissena polymorpha]|uniref:Uncharacterized protein n=1 Tax=Dreissena polymorpha TaxID=45954 RepID=A0A9D4G845_DREPO|nr:hypothetical protein DPMN_140718 [Dreissena polymorpha]